MNRTIGVGRHTSVNPEAPGAGAMGSRHETIKGTPRGGVVSPLLMNIALHSIETEIRVAFSYKESVPQIIS